VVGLYLSGVLMGMFPQAAWVFFWLHVVGFPVLLIGLVVVHLSRTTKVRLMWVRAGRFLQESAKPAAWFMLAVVLLGIIGFPPVVF
jgi:hypothetical protein